MASVEDKQKPAAAALLCLRGGLYSIQTPYGFQLDLGFLKYVEEIERGSQAWTPSRPLQRASQRGPPRGCVRSSMPKKIPFPGRECQPPPGNRVGQTLMEVSHRLQQEQAESLDGSVSSELSQSLPPSPLSSPEYGDDRRDSQDSGVGSDQTALGRKEASVWEEAGRLGSGCRFAAMGDIRDVATETELVETCEIGVGTDEVCLVPDGEMERELQALHHMVEIQCQRIQYLESQLFHAQQKQEVLEQQKAKISKATVETDSCPRCTRAGHIFDSPGGSGQMEGQGPLRKGVASTQSSIIWNHNQSTQAGFTVSESRTAPPEVTSRGSQWESPEEEETESTSIQSSKPAAALLKSIMKRPGGSRALGQKAGQTKSLKFVGILKGGYKSSSSEEEDFEEDGSSSDRSDDEDTFFEERLTNSDIQSEAESEEETEKIAPFEFSAEMQEACLILKSHLDDDISPKYRDDDINAQYGDDVMSSSRTVEREWLAVCGCYAASAVRVSSFLAAFSQMFPGLVECLLNMADLDGNTALHYSLSYSNFAVVRVLLQTGVCDVDLRNKAGFSPVMLAAVASLRTAEDMQTARRIFSQGDINARATQTGHTALMLAVRRRRLDMAWALLDCGADVNAQDGRGYTALMSACQNCHAHMVSLLLQHPGCDISNLRNKDGDTAISIALRASRRDISVLLYTHMNRSVPPSPSVPISTSCTTESESAKAVPGRPPLPKTIGTQRLQRRKN